MLRVVMDALVDVLGIYIVTVGIIRSGLNVSGVSKVRYVVAYILGVVVGVVFRYLRGYQPSGSFLRHVGIEVLVCSLVYVVFRLVYHVAGLIKK